MSDDDLRQAMEDNFRLALVSIREVATTTGNLTEGLQQVSRQTAALSEHTAELSKATAENQERLRTAADRLELALEAIKTLAFGSAEIRAELTGLRGELRADYDLLQARVLRLEEKAS